MTEKMTGRLSGRTIPLRGKEYIRVIGHYERKPRSGTLGRILDSIVGERKVYVKGYTKRIKPE